MLPNSLSSDELRQFKLLATVKLLDKKIRYKKLYWKNEVKSLENGCLNIKIISDCYIG